MSEPRGFDYAGDAITNYKRAIRAEAALKKIGDESLCPTWRFFDRASWDAEQSQLPEAERESWDDMWRRTHPT